MVGLAALVTLGGVALLRQVAVGRQRAEQRATATREAAAAIDAVAASLANAYRPRQGDRVLFEGIDATLNDRPADRLRLRTLGVRGVRGGERESDVREVEYALAAGGDGRVPRLVQRIDPTRNREPDGGGVLQTAAVQVLSMNLAYFDGAAWTSAWPVELQRLPRAVRVEIAVVELDQRGEPRRGPADVVTVARLVSLPPLAGRDAEGEGGAL